GLETDLNVGAGGGSVADNSITDAKLRDSLGTSVIGRSAGSFGDPGDIAASADGQVLVPRSTIPSWNTLNTENFADNQITDAKLRTSTGLSLIGRSGSSTGNVADITGAAKTVPNVAIDGSSLAFTATPQISGLTVNPNLSALQSPVANTVLHAG